MFVFLLQTLNTFLTQKTIFKISNQYQFECDVLWYIKWKKTSLCVAKTLALFIFAFCVLFYIS